MIKLFKISIKDNDFGTSLIASSIREHFNRLGRDIPNISVWEIDEDWNISESDKSPDPEEPQPAPTVMQGWLCPKCGKVNAPWKDSCGCVLSRGDGLGFPATPYGTGDPVWPPHPGYLDFMFHCPKSKGAWSISCPDNLGVTS